MDIRDSPSREEAQPLRLSVSRLVPRQARLIVTPCPRRFVAIIRTDVHRFAD
jgi:hypothetical protein